MKSVSYVLVAIFGLLTILLLPAKIIVFLDGVDGDLLGVAKSEIINIFYFFVLLGINTPVYVILNKWCVHFKTEKRMVALSFFLVLISYLVFTLLYVEPFVFNTIPTMQSSVSRLIALSVMIFILAPITEEVVVRGVILTSLDAGISKVCKHHRIISSILVSLFFSLIHQQYQSPLTYILLILVSLCLCLARFYSQTIWVPISLHFFASCLAVGFPMLAL